jgi:hypothetical protein
VHEPGRVEKPLVWPWCPDSAARDLNRLKLAGESVRSAVNPSSRRRRAGSRFRAIATADAILLRPPAAIRNLPAGELGQLTGLVTRLLDADAAEPKTLPNNPARVETLEEFVI